MATSGAPRKDKEEASSPLGSRHLDVVHEASPAQKKKDEDDLSDKMAAVDLNRKTKKDKKGSDKKPESSSRKEKLKAKPQVPVAPQLSGDQPPLQDAITQAANAKSEKERREALGEIVVQVDKADRDETQSAITLHDQDVQVGRIHNNLDRTDQNLAGAEDDMEQVEHGCYGFLRCIFGNCACSNCCKPREPHHDVEMERRHPAPVLMSDDAKTATSKASSKAPSTAPSTAPVPAVGKQPTEHELRQAALASLKHQEGTLVGEISELKDANTELGQMVDETGKINEQTAADAAKSQAFVKANKM